MNKILLGFGLFFFTITNGYAQNHSRLCICFKENAKYIDINFSEDSALVAFNIVREGFETEEKRKKEKKKWHQGKFPPFEPPISFYYRFLSNKKPIQFSSLKEIKGCAATTTLNEYRKKDFKYPEGTGGSQVYLIQELKDGSYLRWNAILMASE